MHEISNIFTEEKGISLLEEQEVLGKRFIALKKILHTLDNRTMIESRGDYYVT